MIAFNSPLKEAIRREARELSGRSQDYTPLLDAIGDSRFVLIGEASHGTHDFYAARAAITRRLIDEKDFAAVIVEADWPDAYRVNRFVRGFADDPDAQSALSGFKRFPQWMWRNRDVLDFVQWLKERNSSIERGGRQAGFYGMDLYSLYSSMAAVLEYLDKTDHAAATRARYRYSCFEAFREDPQAYGYAAGFDLERSCEGEAVRQLMELRERAAEFVARDGQQAEDEFFFAEQNARLVKNAEEYYRSMFRGRVSSWNLRDQHMTQTIGALADFLDRSGPRSKLIVWAHNSHLGDARATEMGAGGEWNVGQLMRQRYADNVFNIGFTTHDGTVTAADDWDEAAQMKGVRSSMDGSYERLFHETEMARFMLLLRGNQQLADLLRGPNLERAIGVIYRPQTERLSHYFSVSLPEQFDAVIHFDRTSAVIPLEKFPVAEPREVEETFPTGV